MKAIRTASFIRISSKFFNDTSCMCEHCYQYLTAKTITENPKHMYNIGQMFLCPCGKSKLWTNSIRNEEKLIQFLNQKAADYSYGFCNDPFCGKCFGYLIPFKNGIMVPGDLQRYDRWGCKKCDLPPGSEMYNVKALVVDGFKKTPENRYSVLTEWYRKRLPELMSLIPAQSGPTKLTASNGKALR